MASYDELGGNRYKVYVDVGEEDGPRKRRTKTITATSDRDLKKKILAFEIKCKQDIEDAKKKAEEAEKELDNISFNEFADKWWKNHVLEYLAVATRDSYSYYLPMAREFFGEMKLREIKRMDINEFFIKERELNRKSLIGKSGMLKSVFGIAIEWDILTVNPMYRYKLKGYTPPEERPVFGEKELELFYTLLDHEGERNRLMLLATSLGALRRGETLGFGVDVIDFKTNTVHITRSLNWDRDLKKKFLGLPKGKRSRSIVYPESFMKELKIFAFKQNSLRYQFGDQWELVDDVDLLFRTSYGTIMHPQSFTNLWKSICKRMNIKVIDLHDLRHSAASYLVREGTNIKVVQEFLGHKDSSTTMNTYVHTNEEDKLKPALAFEKLL